MIGGSWWRERRILLVAVLVVAVLVVAVLVRGWLRRPPVNYPSLSP